MFICCTGKLYNDKNVSNEDKQFCVDLTGIQIKSTCSKSNPNPNPPGKKVQKSNPNPNPHAQKKDLNPDFANPDLICEHHWYKTFELKM